MRFAISTSPQRTSWQWLLDVWKLADTIDVFESGWTFDHLYPLFGDSTEDCLEGWITLTALLQATSRLRGGVLVTGMVYRHPGLLAKMATTLDITSGGRLELGVGAGWNEEECDAFGLDLGSLKQRFDRFEEGLAVIESLMTNDRTTFTGEYYQLAEAMNNPKPRQSHLPICIGGQGRRRTLPLAGKYADHWNFSGTDPVAFAECRAILTDACTANGRQISNMTTSYFARWTDADALLYEIDQFEAVGCDLAIISLPKTEHPAVVEAVAGAIARR
jgi:F420-dependent oxidoreductase-like protein